MNFLQINLIFKMIECVSFTQAMSLSLEFKLTAEIIETVIIRDLNEFAILAALAILRVVITIVLHWDLKSYTKIIS